MHPYWRKNPTQLHPTEGDQRVHSDLDTHHEWISDYDTWSWRFTSSYPYWFQPWSAWFMKGSRSKQPLWAPLIDAYGLLISRSPSLHYTFLWSFIINNLNAFKPDQAKSVSNHPSNNSRTLEKCRQRKPAQNSREGQTRNSSLLTQRLSQMS